MPGWTAADMHREMQRGRALERARIAAEVRALPLHGGWTRFDDVPRFVALVDVLDIVLRDPPVVAPDWVESGGSAGDSNE